MALVKKQFKIIRVVSILAVLLSACKLPDRPANDPAVLSAKLSEVEGKVKIRPGANGEFITAGDGQVLGSNGEVLTQENGTARIDLSTEGIIRVAPLTFFTLEDADKGDADSPTRIKLDIGQVWIIARGGALEVGTPGGTVTVEKAYLGVVVGLGGDVQITCFKGPCNFENESGKLALDAGQWIAVLGKVQDQEQKIDSGMMVKADLDAWVAANPEAADVLPEVIATQEWLKDPHVKLPELACLADNTCATFCAPQGWTPTSEADPDPAAMPEVCRLAAESMAGQGVDPNQFLVCLVLGKNTPQDCADQARAK
jgi:hypothetical protein